MDLDEYLKQDSIIKEIENEYQKLLTRATKMTPSYAETIKSNIISSKVEENAVKMADLIQQYKDIILMAEQTKLRIIKQINTLDEPYRSVLHKRYIEGMDYKQIADNMGYSLTHIYKLKDVAESIYKHEKK